MNTKYKICTNLVEYSNFHQTHTVYAYFAITHSVCCTCAIVLVRHARNNANALQALCLRHIQRTYNACQARTLNACNVLSRLSLYANYSGCTASLQTAGFHLGGPTRVFPPKSSPYFQIPEAPPRVLFCPRYTLAWLLCYKSIVGRLKKTCNFM